MYKIITKVINKKIFNSKIFSDKEIKKTIRLEITEDKDEYFVIKAINNQTKQNNSPRFIDNTKIIPK